MARRGARTQRHGIGLGLGAALMCWALLAALHLAGAFEIADLKLLDWRYRIRGPRVASDSIAIVEVDDATIAAYGRWPLPRETYGILIAALEDAGARAIGMDLLFLGNDADNPNADRLLSTLTAGDRSLVHAISFLPEDPSLGYAAIPAESQRLLERHGVPLKGGPVSLAARVSLPYAELLGAAHALGHASVAVDPDGVVRRIPQFVRYGGRAYPSLSLRLWEVAHGDSLPPPLEPVPGGLRVRWTADRSGFVPVDGQGATPLDFAGDRSAFGHRVPMLDALRAYRDGDLDSLRREVGGRVVLIGTTAVGEAVSDQGPTPFSVATPLLYIHANALNAVFEGRYLTRPPVFVQLAVLGVLALALGWLLTTLSLGGSALAVLASLVGIALADYLLFALRGIDAPLTMGLALPVATYAAIESYRQVFLERRTREREREMALARLIQQKLLPVEPPAIPGLDIAGINIPAQEVGGDYFDWVPLGDGRLAVAVGDVSGKGVAAALLMAHLRASLHAESRVTASPAAILSAMHESLSRAVEPGRFATFFLAIVPRQGDGLRYCSAGHNPALLVHDGHVEQLGSTGGPLALPTGVPYVECEQSFLPGDALVIYSDGITECPRKDELYGEERLTSLVLTLVERRVSAAEMQRAILADLRAFARGDARADDITLVIVRRG